MKSPDKISPNHNLPSRKFLALGGLCLSALGLLMPTHQIKNDHVRPAPTSWTTAEIVAKYPHGGEITSEADPNDMLLVSGGSAFFSSNDGKSWNILPNPVDMTSGTAHIDTASFAPVKAMDPAEAQPFVIVYENKGTVEIQMDQVEPDGTVKQINHSSGPMNLDGATGTWTRDDVGLYYTENAAVVGQNQLEDLGVGTYVTSK